jgi:hypothetical protein
VRYWWVNQNQTYRHEVGGCYLWSPKRKSDGSRNPFYEAMREVAPGDVVLSFCDTRIAALGIVKSYCYESPKPTEFGTAGVNWEAIGWKVETAFGELNNRVRPKDFVGELVPHLPPRYSPLRPNGDGLQSVYLTEIGAPFAAVIFRRIGSEVATTLQAAEALRDAERVSPAPEPTLEEWEQREEIRIRDSDVLAETTRRALIQARRGQGVFRQNVQRVERACRVTRVERAEHLIASHIQPWRDSSNDERLDGENGLLLTPTVDHLFDKGFISFKNDGDMIISPVADRVSLQRMGIDPGSPPQVGAFSTGQRRFLDYHRENVLRMMHR